MSPDPDARRARASCSRDPRERSERRPQIFKEFTFEAAHRLPFVPAGPQVPSPARPQLPGRGSRRAARSIRARAGSLTSPTSRRRSSRCTTNSTTTTSTRSPGSRTPPARTSPPGSGIASSRHCPGSVAVVVRETCTSGCIYAGPLPARTRCEPARSPHRPSPTADVQAQPDDRGIAIDRVGIRGLRYPILIETRGAARSRRSRIGNLPSSSSTDQRGTHMSRFVETLEQWNAESMTGRASLRCSPNSATDSTLRAPSARCDLTLFIERAAPVSGLSAQHAIDCSLRGVRRRIATSGLTLGRARSGDHTLPVQQGDQRVRRAQPARLRRDQRRDRSWRRISAFEDLIAVAEASGSAPIYPLLKRVDERHVTMQAYDAPTFVEDVVRNAAARSRRRRADLALHGRGREPREHPRPLRGRDRPLGARMSDRIRVITTCTSRKAGASRPNSSIAALPGLAAPRTLSRPSASTPASSTDV